MLCNICEKVVAPMEVLHLLALLSLVLSGDTTAQVRLNTLYQF